MDLNYSNLENHTNMVTNYYDVFSLPQISLNYVAPNPINKILEVPIMGPCLFTPNAGTYTLNTAFNTELIFSASSTQL